MAAAKKAKPAGKTVSADAITLLKADHRKVEDLFEKFEKTKSDEKKAALVKQICTELIVHTTLEEEIYYPACREAGVEHDDLDEAQVEHDGAKTLISDLMKETPAAEYYDAKVKVLSEYIKHHVKEEEQPREGIFAKSRQAEIDLKEVGRNIAERKQELLADVKANGLHEPEPRAVGVT